MAIQNLIDNGIHVVGAGGAFSGGTFPQGDLFSLDFSCCGMRGSVHDWGEDVAATVANCVGYCVRTLGENPADLSPALLRTLLINTGTPQDTWTTRMIGPRPDLERAFRDLEYMAPARFLEVDLELPASHFSEGDLFNLRSFINYPGYNQGDLPLVVILEVPGLYWFFPTWTHTFNYQMLDVPSGYTSYEILPDFYWPAGVGSASGLRFYGALLTPDMLSIFGLYDMEEFSYGE